MNSAVKTLQKTLKKTLLYLPDLGEGLTEAEIVQWLIQPGEYVQIDQPLVEVETAKALVEIPSPVQGQVTACYAAAGTAVRVGQPLLEFEQIDEHAQPADLVGELPGANQEQAFMLEADPLAETPSRAQVQVQATPAVRWLIQTLGLDTKDLRPSQSHRVLTLEDIKPLLLALKQTGEEGASLTAGFTQRLQGTRLQMANTITRAHSQVAQVTVFDDANISELPAEADLTVYLIQALWAACQAEPSLNAWSIDNGLGYLSRRLHSELHLGLAIDSGEHLFLPTLHHANRLDAPALRQRINALKQAAEARTFTPQDLQGATLLLSNFGVFSGRYATPMVMPPAVAILGVGKAYTQLALDHQHQLTWHRYLPLSLSFDHRLITGGEATRFLKHLISRLVSGPSFF